MKTGNIMNDSHLDKMNEISFRQLSAYSMTNCVEDKIVLIDNLSLFPFDASKEGNIVTDFVAIFFCTEGSLEMNLNGRRYTMGEGEILYGSQRATLCNVVMSSSCKGKVLCVSWEYGQMLFLRSACRWNCMLQLCNHPLLHPSVDELELYRAYYRLLVVKLNCYCYASDTDYIFQGFFYDFYRMIDRYFKQKVSQEIPLNSIRQEDLFKRFITLLKENHSHEHTCSFYAGRICVTPKYLTTVVKKVSGKSVSQWINIYLMEQIKYYLKTTNLTVAEIADELNFSNTSFFGKYVKMHTGTSPAKLRRTLQAAYNAEMMK